MHDRDGDVHSYKDMEKLQKIFHFLSSHLEVHPLHIPLRIPISLVRFFQFLEDIQL